MPTPPADDRIFRDVRALLLRGRVRLRRRAMLRGAVLGLWAGLLAALALAAASRLWWPVPVAPWSAVVPVAVLGPVLGAVLGGARRSLRPREVAFVLDRVLRTDELLVTALQLEREGETWAHRGVLDELARRLPTLPSPAEALPVQVPRRSGWLLLVALAAVGLLLVPQRPGAVARPEPETLVQEEAARLEERKAELDEEFAVALPREVEAEFEELVRDLRAGELSEQEARERISELQDQLGDLQERLEASREALEDLERAADELARDAATRDLAEALREGDAAAAAQEAKELAEQLAEASDEERRRAGEALERAGERLARSSDPALERTGGAMERAGEQLQGGERGEGQEQGEGQQGEGQEQAEGQQGEGQQGEGQQEEPTGGSSELEQLSQELERQQDLAERLKEDGERLARSQQMNGALEGSSQRLGGEGTVADGTSSGAPGEGPGAPASDWGTGHTWEDQGTTASTGEGHHDADRQDATRTSGQEVDDFERLYDPVRMEGAQGLLSSVGGEIDQEGHVDLLPTRLTGSDEDAAAPLLTLPESYREAADQALSGERVPPGYREAVKQYFDSME